MPSKEESQTKVWIDADACPKVIKEIVWRSGQRLQIPVILVANSSMQVPLSPWVTLVVVEKGLDVADHYILDNSRLTDLVITADIPLAHSLVTKGVLAINPRGEVYTEENVGDILATRNLMGELREGGLVQGGPPPIGPKDKARFAAAFDRELTRRVRR